MRSARLQEPGTGCGTLSNCNEIRIAQPGEYPGTERTSLEAHMRRIAIALALAGALVMPGSVLAFHHGGLPSTECAAEAAGSPSNDNGMAKESILANTPLSLPLAPVGTPGNGQGDGGDHCANHDH
jgi:hypothetical protein